MFDIGFWEMILISILALVVIGPERLPKVARVAGHWVGKTRRFIEGVKGEVEQQFDTNELKRLLHNQDVQIKELQNKLEGELGHIDKEFHSIHPDAESLEFVDEDEDKTKPEPASKTQSSTEDDDVMISQRSKQSSPHDG